MRHREIILKATRIEDRSIEVKLTIKIFEDYCFFSFLKEKYFVKHKIYPDHEHNTINNLNFFDIESIDAECQPIINDAFAAFNKTIRHYSSDQDPDKKAIRHFLSDQDPDKFENEVNISGKSQIIYYL